MDALTAYEDLTYKEIAQCMLVQDNTSCSHKNNEGDQIYAGGDHLW